LKPAGIDWHIWNQSQEETTYNPKNLAAIGPIGYPIADGKWATQNAESRFKKIFCSSCNNNLLKLDMVCSPISPLKF